MKKIHILILLFLLFIPVFVNAESIQTGKFKYTIDGNKISFKFTDEDMETLDTTFSIDGDTLNVKDSNNEDTLYKKVK